MISTAGRLCIALLLVMAPLADRAQAELTDFLLIDRTLRMTPVRVVELGERDLVVLGESSGHETLPLAECIALLRIEPDPVEAPSGVLLLNDGQRLPGRLAANTPPAPDQLTWIHPWLAPINVPLDQVQSLRTVRTQPVPQPRVADVVVLANGDRLEGFVTAVGETIAIEVDLDGRPQTLRVPFERLAALALVNPRRKPTGTRVWFAGATVLDVDEIAMGDDGYVRYAAALTGGSPDPVRTRLSDVRAVLFDPRAMTPLAELEPTQIASRVPRFLVPPPRLLDREAALDLSRIEYRGPLLVRYALPAGATRFAARAVLPNDARQWGDVELIVRDNDNVVVRARLNASSPTASINVELSGSELTVELAEGAHGPIQDRVVLERAMLLIE